MRRAGNLRRGGLPDRQRGLPCAGERYAGDYSAAARAAIGAEQGLRGARGADVARLHRVSEPEEQLSDVPEPASRAAGAPRGRVAVVLRDGIRGPAHVPFA